MAAPLRSSGRQAFPNSSAMRANMQSFLALGLFGGVVNIVVLTGAVFMIQIYDRVLISRSLPTLMARRGGTDETGRHRGPIRRL